MTSRFRSSRVSLGILATALVCAVGAALLPDDPYQRSQLLDDTIHRKARWIYERTHYDDVPIDIVAIGSSRIGAGFDAPRLAAALDARGLPANVVNFSLPEAGRDINYAVFEEVLETKRPKLLVLSVAEKPSRVGHSAFKYLARSGLVADPAYVSNLNFGSNLAYLPFRQMELSAARIAPGFFGLRKDFDPGRYWGHSKQSTGDILLPGGKIKEGDDAAPLAELERGVHKLEKGSTPPILPASMSHIEFGDEYVWTRRIAELAQQHNVKIVFLFIPYYTGSSKIQEQAFYERYGDVWNAGFVSPRADLFSDYGHLTSGGAKVVTDSMIPRFVAKMQAITGQQAKPVPTASAPATAGRP